MYRLNVVWELRASETDELITTYENRWLENFEFTKQPKKIREKIKKIILKYCGYFFDDEEDYDDWTDYALSVGEGKGEEANDYKTIEEFKRKVDFSDFPFYFLRTIRREEYDSPADYYTIQDYGYEESSCVIASYKTFEEAETYCKENNISVNNIIPQTFGNNFVELCDI